MSTGKSTIRVSFTKFTVYYHTYQLVQLQKEIKKLEKKENDKTLKATERRNVEQMSAGKTPLQIACQEIANASTLPAIKPNSDKEALFVDSLRNLMCKGPQVILIVVV